jgi:hypothetical protein
MAFDSGRSGVGLVQTFLQNDFNSDASENVNLILTDRDRSVAGHTRPLYSVDFRCVFGEQGIFQIPSIDAAGSIKRFSRMANARSEDGEPVRQIATAEGDRAGDVPARRAGLAR